MPVACAPAPPPSAERRPQKCRSVTSSDFETECATVVAIGFEVGGQVGPGRLDLDLEST